MVTTLKAKEPLPEIEKVETDHENLHLSRDEFEAKYRKKRELKARLELEKQRIEAELEAEGKEDVEEIDPDKVQTVADAKKRGRPAKT